jgi:hypothetical protein
VGVRKKKNKDNEGEEDEEIDFEVNYFLEKRRGVITFCRANVPPFPFHVIYSTLPIFLKCGLGLLSKNIDTLHTTKIRPRIK